MITYCIWLQFVLHCCKCVNIVCRILEKVNELVNPDDSVNQSIEEGKESISYCLHSSTDPTRKSLTLVDEGC